MNPDLPQAPASGREAVFSYGTLREAAVQQRVFGRELSGRPDEVPGFGLQEVIITDPDVIALSGKDRHTGLVATGDERDSVSGTVFDLGRDQLLAVDEYESAYERVRVALVSGGEAWTYVPKAVSSSAPPPADA